MSFQNFFQIFPCFFQRGGQLFGNFGSHNEKIYYSQILFSLSHSLTHTIGSLPITYFCEADFKFRDLTDGSDLRITHKDGVTTIFTHKMTLAGEIIQDLGKYINVTFIFQYISRTTV